MKRLVGWAVLAVLVGGGLASRARGLAARPRARVEAGSIERVVVARGQVLAQDGAMSVRPAVTGRVSRVLVREGDRVEAGTLLAELDRAPFDAELDRRRAELEALRALVPDGGPVSLRDAARARVRGAEAAVHAAELDADNTRLRAPGAGTVLARNVAAGEVLGPSAPQPAFELADLARVEVRLELEEQDATLVREGASVELRSVGGRGALGTATLERLGARLEPRSVGRDDPRARASALVRVAWARFAQGTTAPPVGTRLEGRVRMEPRAAATRVPREAVVVREGRALLEQAGVLSVRELPVTVEDSDERFVAVRGVSAGTEVLAGP